VLFCQELFKNGCQEGKRGLRTGFAVRGVP
jgi:hypothetical protein